MSPSELITVFALLVPFAGLIIYYDVRFRRIPNLYVGAILLCAVIIKTYFGGAAGAVSALAAAALGLGLMLIPHLLGQMGAGDVKLFAAVSAVVGLKLVVTNFVVVVLTGGLLALFTTLYAGTVMSTMQGVIGLFVGILPGRKMPRFNVPADRRYTVPYGVAIMVGSLISLAYFRA